MTERPILFSAPMVRAILDGTKTQTRRIAKKMVRHPDLGNLYTPGALVLEGEPQHVIERACPYGRPGDRLWVREAWRVINLADVFAPREITAADRIWFEADGPHEPPAGRYRPGMFMPRWASRITLEITGVRVERLQEISRADAQAEGCHHDDPCDHKRRFCEEIGCEGPDYRVGFRNLWESINGPESWAANPWVWVIEFRRVSP